MGIISHGVWTQCMLTMFMHSRCLHAHISSSHLPASSNWKYNAWPFEQCCILGFRYIPAVIVIVDGRRAYWPKQELWSWGRRTWGGNEMNPVKLVLPHPIVPEQDNSPGNSLIVFNEHGWLGACFGEKEGAGNCENSENARLICKGNEVDIKHGYCPPPSLPSLISLDALFKVSLKFSKSSFWMSQHRWCSILLIQRRIYVLRHILLNKGSYITEEVMLLCFNRYCDEKNFASNFMARDQVKMSYGKKPKRLLTHLSSAGLASKANKNSTQ